MEQNVYARVGWLGAWRNERNTFSCKLWERLEKTSLWENNRGSRFGDMEANAQK